MPPAIVPQRLAAWALASAGEAAPADPGIAAASAAAQIRQATPRIGGQSTARCHTSPPLMSRNGRIALIAAAIVVAVLAFVIASPGDDEGGGQAAQTTTQAETGGEETGPAETAPAETEGETEAEPVEPPEP